MNKIGKFRRAICGPRFFSAAVNNVGQLVIRIMKLLFNAGSNVGAVSVRWPCHGFISLWLGKRNFMNLKPGGVTYY